MGGTSWAHFCPHAPKSSGPFRGPNLSGSEKEVLDRSHVRCLQALLALHDLELDALTFGQRLVALHRDRREVDEDVLALLALDEAVTLLVREPLNGALSQLCLLATSETTARAPSRRPTVKRAKRSVTPWGTQDPHGDIERP